MNAQNATPHLTFDRRIDILELEWHRVSQSANAARARYESLRTDPGSCETALHSARECLMQAESLQNQVLEKIKILEVRSMELHRRLARRTA